MLHFNSTMRGLPVLIIIILTFIIFFPLFEQIQTTFLTIFQKVPLHILCTRAPFQPVRPCNLGSEDLFQRNLVKRTLGQRTFFKGSLVQKDLLARGPFPKDHLHQRTFGEKGPFLQGTFCQKDLFSKGPFVKKNFCRKDLLGSRC